MSSGTMKQFSALFFKLRRQSSRISAIAYHMMTLTLPIGLLISCYYMRSYARNNMRWAVSMTSGFLQGFLGHGNDKDTRIQLQSLLSSVLDGTLIFSFLIVCLFALPIQTSAFVSDRIEGLRDLLHKMGLSRFVYWAGNGLFNLILLLGNLSVLLIGVLNT